MRGRIGARLDALVRRSAATPGLIPLGGGLPSDEQFPRAALGAAFVRVLSQRGAPALQYGWPEGMESLRARICRRLRSRRMVGLEPRDIIVTNGAQQAIALVADLLARPDDAIAVDAQSYPSALELFRSRRLKLVSPTAAERATAVYAMPVVSNPTGKTLLARERAKLLGLGRPIVEDEAYADLAFDGPPPPPIGASARDQVFLVGTFSKILCPGLRVGWLVVPARWRARLLRLKEAADLQSNGLAQAVVDDYLAHNDLEQRLAGLRKFYRQRAARLATAVRRHLPSWAFQFPTGGFSLWIDTDARVDELKLVEAAIGEGVGLDPGMTFLARHDEDRPTSLRLCFSLARPSDFEEGARRLARAWRRLGPQRRGGLPLGGASSRGRAGSAGRGAWDAAQ